MRPDSFRTGILLIVLVVGVVPLVVLGFWLTRTAARSGEALLHARLEQALENTATEVGRRWVVRRSALLDFAELPAVRALLDDSEPDNPQLPADAAAQRLSGVTELALASPDAQARVAILPAPSPGAPEALRVSLPVYDVATRRDIGVLQAGISLTSLLEARDTVPGVAGVVVGAFDPTSGASFLPWPFDPRLVERERFDWAGESWLVARHALAEPPLVLVAAAPLAPFTAPFASAARRGTWLLLVVSAAGLTLAFFVTARMTRSLERLATAADAVARGEFDHRVETAGVNEVGRVARAFNTMTDSLRRILHELAERKAQAQAGEFAASLAHEVRNPLTAIRVDLQVVEERLPPDSPLRAVQARALHEITRLDTTVVAALDHARSGQLGTRVLDILDPLRAAVRAASPIVVERGVYPIAVPANAESAIVRGEPGALEQLFLNLLMNAAQAVEPGGEVTTDVCSRDSWVVVSIRDTGPGIPEEVRERAFQPFVSTRAGGTGLGLPIARRIARAHGGDIGITSGATGTTVEVTLPLAG